MSEENKAPKPTLNDKPVTTEQLQEEKEALKNNERIVEKSPNEYRKIHRMQG